MAEDNKVANFIDTLDKGDNANAGEIFKDALRDKVADALDAQRVEVAKNIFSGATAMPHSDPKPVVTDPAERTDVVMNTDGKPIEFTPNGNEHPTPTAEVPEAPVRDESKPTT